MICVLWLMVSDFMRLSNEDGGGSMKEEFKIRLSRLSVRGSLGLSAE